MRAGPAGPAARRAATRSRGSRSVPLGTTRTRAEGPSTRAMEAASASLVAWKIVARRSAGAKAPSHARFLRVEAIDSAAGSSEPRGESTTGVPASAPATRATMDEVEKS